MKSTIKEYFLRSKNINVINIYRFYIRFFKCSDELFLNRTNGFIFVHNPKVAGTSLKQFLALDISDAIHLTPSYFLSKKEWESNLTIVAVRHPIDRLISSFLYHTSARYTGAYLSKYTKLKDMSFEEYFNTFKNEPWAIRPQYDYCQHIESTKMIDVVIKYESINDDVIKLKERLNINNDLPHLNASKKLSYDEIDGFKSLKQEIISYYYKDLEYFGYTV
jgi:chondroitin 4-sulfotransferase 11